MTVRVGTIVIPPGLTGQDLRAWLEAQGRTFSGPPSGTIQKRARARGAQSRQRSRKIDAALKRTRTVKP